MSRIANIHTLTRRLIVMTAISLLAFAALFFVSYWLNERFMLTWAAFIVGIVGGFVSIQQRIKKVSDEELELLSQSWFQILLIPIFGGVFSLVLYCVFLAELLNGGLFPSFDIPEPSQDGPDNEFMRNLFFNTFPKTGQDFAKFLFWSFAAGFSERLVPQVISKITSGVHKNSG